MARCKIKLPHTLVLILTIMLIVAASTWIIPGGQYLRQLNPDGREVVVDGSFIHTERNPQGLFAVLQAPLKGMSASADIISFILIVGGVFAILQKTLVIDAAILRLADRLRGRETIIIPAGMLIFSVFGAVFGMSEEVIPFVLIFIPMALATGYDSLTGVAIPFLGAGVGFAGALLNPFTIGIAQGIAELPLFSGLLYRLVVWIILTLVAIAWVTHYAIRVKKHPQSSPVYAWDQNRRQELEDERAEHIEFSRRHRVILWVFGATIVCMAWGVMQYQWFIAEISGLFLGLGIASGLIAGLTLQEMADAFVDGARDLMGAAFVVGFARAILILASDGQIIDTLMHALAQAIRPLPSVLAAQLMMVIQTLINFFVPSGSGKAALTMPIMVPLADLIGITRQTSVLAYQLGDGLTNMIIPTSGVTMGVLGMARIPWEIWARWLWPIVLVLFVIGLFFMIPPVIWHWGPF